MKSSAKKWSKVWYIQCLGLGKRSKITFPLHTIHKSIYQKD